MIENSQFLPFKSGNLLDLGGFHVEAPLDLNLELKYFPDSLTAVGV